jgi:hypothetical protein
MPVAIALLMTLTAGPPRFETAGLALAAEAGRFAGGYGIDAVYYHPVGGGGPPVTVVVHLGAGISGQLPRAPAFGGSVGASLGQRHRPVVALGWGTIGRSTLSLHGTEVADRSLYGPDVSAGYEHVSARGLVFRALAGAAYLPGSWLETTARWRPTLSVAFGWKIW